jgi:hypothetical protein
MYTASDVPRYVNAPALSTTLASSVAKAMSKNWTPIELLMLCEFVGMQLSSPQQPSAMDLASASPSPSPRGSPSSPAAFSLPSPVLSPTSVKHKAELSTVAWDKISLYLIARSIRENATAFFSKQKCQRTLARLCSEISERVQQEFESVQDACAACATTLRVARAKELEMNTRLLSKFTQLYRNELQTLDKEQARHLDALAMNVGGTSAAAVAMPPPSAMAPSSSSSTAMVGSSSSFPGTSSSSSSSAMLGVNSNASSSSSSSPGGATSSSPALQPSAVQQPVPVEPPAPLIRPQYNLEQLKAMYTGVWDHVNAQPNVEVFRFPVTEAEAKDYFKYVSHPMDLQTVQKEINGGGIRTPMDLHSQLSLIFMNACIYNDRSSFIFKLAKKLDIEMCRHMASVFPEWGDIFSTMKLPPAKKTSTKKKAARNRKAPPSPAVTAAASPVAPAAAAAAATSDQKRGVKRTSFMKESKEAPEAKTRAPRTKRAKQAEEAPVAPKAAPKRKGRSSRRR